MRRLMPTAAFVLFLTLPLWGQHGGGHAGGSHAGGSRGGSFSGHAGFGGGHPGGGHVSGGRRSGMGSSRGFSSRGLSSRGFTRAPSFAQRSSARGHFLRDGFRGHRFRRGFGNRFRTFGFRNNCFAFPCRGFGYPWAYGGYYDPFWWGDSGSSYDEDYERDRAVADQMNERSLAQQQMQREEEADGDQDAYSPRSSRQHSDPAANSNQGQPGAAIVPATVLVFRDQHRQEIQNYAIVGQTLWNFVAQRAEKIPLSDLDLSTTAQANEDRGLTFRVPETGESQ
jgi:hypothetical protein